MAVFKRRKSRSRTLKTATLLLTMWRWLPASEKRRVIRVARHHGPRLVSTAMHRGRRRRRR
jgi:hypothetical protein